MSERGIDVLMKVVGPSGAFAAESSTAFVTKPVTDLLRNGFTPGQFCELQAFSFSAGAKSALKDDDEKKRDEEAKRREREAKGEDQGSGMTYREKMETIFGGMKERRRNRKATDPVDMQPVEFTRIMDCMSPQLFQALVNCDTLESLSVVKRRATGGVAGGSNSGDCYLRLDFSKVLITELDWKDAEHAMIETGTFIYRKVTLRYRPQKPDGSLDVAIQMEWEMQAAGNAGKV